MERIYSSIRAEYLRQELRTAANIYQVHHPPTHPQIFSTLHTFLLARVAMQQRYI